MQKVKIQKLALTIMIVILSLIFSACGSKEPEIDIDAQRTGFAQTANVQATMTAEAQPSATQTQVPPATSTPTQEFTTTSEVTATATEDEEAPAPTATTGTVAGVDTANWLSNDPVDKSDFAPGETFKVTWKIENKGTTTWTTNYYIQFASGVQMTTDDKVFIPYPVPPNTNVQISVNFTATDETGEKRSNWKLFNDKETAFFDFYFIVDVVEPSAEEPTVEATTETTVTPTITVTPTVTATTEE